MPDGLEAISPDRLREIELAADPLRFRLLQHAARSGPFRNADAPAIVETTTPDSGNAREHIRQLVAAGLLERRGRPAEFSITERGRQILEAMRAAAGGDVAPPPVGADVTLVALLAGGSDMVVAGPSDLLAEIDRRLRESVAHVLASYPVV